MRLYTAFINDQEKILVGFSEKSKVYLSEDLGLNFHDMNDLICNMTEEQKENLYQMAEDGIEERAYDIEELELLAPIVRPRQDVICLGINYDEHAKEAGMYSEEAFGGERP